ncbi:uncharacterized protein LOC127859426 [Dreissena polymorpha]|uniref:uncharacterized protein LOC127859426 n=1 Tax=Dreissena polymorpha TaxID=45954 RepID=UPI00226519FE|nr:uncharacterized protein LOC127859426 [Dreissena polymorpha]
MFMSPSTFVIIVHTHLVLIQNLNMVSMISLQAVNEEGFRNQALKGIEALNKKVDGLETKADREDEFRRHVLDQLKEMKESINNLHRKMADSRHKADEKTEP